MQRLDVVMLVRFHPGTPAALRTENCAPAAGAGARTRMLTSSGVGALFVRDVAITARENSGAVHKRTQ